MPAASGWWEQGETSEFYEHGPITTLHWLNVHSFIRNNGMWSSMAVNKAFYKSVNGSFGRSIAHKEGTFISRVHAYSSKNKMLPLP